jgi:hypothetical protein
LFILYIAKFRENLSKTWKNIKRNILHYQSFSVIKIDNDFSHRNSDRVSEPLKFRRYLYFRQVVRSSNCPFGKMSIRQNVRSAKRPFGKTSVGKMSVRQNYVFRQNVFRQSVFRQNVRPPTYLHINQYIK